MTDSVSLFPIYGAKPLSTKASGFVVCEALLGLACQSTQVIFLLPAFTPPTTGHTGVVPTATQQDGTGPSRWSTCCQHVWACLGPWTTHLSL